MSYVVFARKWRPLTFDDVVGQEHITETLKKAIDKNRVAHAYIFTGTRGVGKTTTARIMARALNCEKGPTTNPCGECTSCKNILSGSSFDVLEIDGASNNSVDDIRELRDNIGYSSMGGKHRIYVIDEVHMLTKSAFNALLKTLEEPPKNVIFIFATTEPQKIPPTIHSRCQRYDFKRIGAEQILGRLIDICSNEKIAFEKSALMLVARKADGSMRDSLSLLDQVYSFCQENLTEKEVRKVLGLVGLDVFNTVIDAITTRTAAPALKAVQDVLYQGFDLQEFLLGLQEHIRNLLFARIPGALEARGVEIEPEIAQLLVKSAERFSEGDLFRMSEIIRKAENELKWSAFPRFHVEITILKLVFLDSTVSIEQILAMAANSLPPGELPPNIVSGIQAPQVRSENAELKKKLETDHQTADSVEKKIIEAVVADEPPLTYGEPSDQKDGRGTLEEVQAKYGADKSDNNGTVVDNYSLINLDNSSDSASFEDKLLDGEIKDVTTIWPLFLDHMLKNRPNLGSFLSMGYVASCSETNINIKFSSSSSFQFQEVTKKANRDQIERLLHEFTSSKIELHITVETKKPDAQERQFLNQLVQGSSTINDEIENEPIIQVVLDIFDGEVLN